MESRKETDGYIIRRYKSGFEIELNDIVLEMIEHKVEWKKGCINVIIRTGWDLALGHAFDVDRCGWDNAIKTLETIERLVSKAIELAKEYMAKRNNDG
jgi:hypothetical protein